MAGLFVLAPLVLAVLGGTVVVVLVLRRRTPSTELSLPVACARRRGVRYSALAVGCGVTTAAVVGALGIWTRREAVVLIAPLNAATVHAVVVLIGELTWPRPTARIRGARLVARSMRDTAPPWLLWTCLVSAGVVVALCVGGVATAGLRADSYTWTTSTLSYGSATFPGGRIALPVLSALATTVLATGAVLHRLPARPAITGASDVADATLRRAGGHRVLRMSGAAALGTCGVLLVMWSGFLTAWRASVDQQGNVSEGPLAGLTGPVVYSGFLVVLVGVAVLLVPARGIRA
ncbi:MAG: hypothetical protein ACRYF3_03825 [Janthinobacterium lividum]